MQNADFRFTERDFCAAQYLNTIANSKTQQCRTFNRATITYEFSIRFASGVPGSARAYPFYACT